jgi:hypothetical protein
VFHVERDVNFQRLLWNLSGYGAWIEHIIYFISTFRCSLLHFAFELNFLLKLRLGTRDISLSYLSFGVKIFTLDRCAEECVQVPVPVPVSTCGDRSVVFFLNKTTADSATGFIGNLV